MDASSHLFSVAPMLDWTDRHCRFFLRQISRRARLYTEMVTVPALVHGDAEKLLAFGETEHPLALQIGGSVPKDCAYAAKLAQRFGYDEINLNCGCPSDRVQSGAFGAVLMKTPALVADCVAAMREACDLPVTVKHRIGLDDCEDYGFARDFVGTVAEAGCQLFIVHARNAILKGLSPRENRDIPPLRYEVVARLKRDFPSLRFVLNGGVKDWDAVKKEIGEIGGVMVGRWAYHQPWDALSRVDSELFGEEPPHRDRRDAMLAMIEYAEREVARGATLHSIMRHMLGLYAGQPNARLFRQKLSAPEELARNEVAVMREALALVEGR